MEENENVLVMIYSTECPNCKFARKQFADCAKQAQVEKINAKLAAIDGEKYKNDIYSLWTDDMGVPTLFWYQNGKKQFEYVGQRAYADMLDFIKTPRKPREKKKFPIWETQESASEIEHLDDSTFDEFVADQEDMLVFFHSRTSEACFKIRKSYEKAARSLARSTSNVAMVAIDVEKGLVLKHKYNVEKVPFIGYFRGNRLKYQYHGGKKAKKFVKFLKNPEFTPPKKAQEWKDMNTNVTILQNTNFVDFIKENKRVLVMFFAKWCGHCKTFKPKYIEAADMMKEENVSGLLAAINADDAKQLMSRYGVKGLPTVLYFEDGSKKEVYNGQRNAEAVVKFMKGKSCVYYPPESPMQNGGCQWVPLLLRGMSKEKEDDQRREDDFEQDKPELVTSLNPTNLEEFLEETPEAFVMFYAPWCSACKQSKKAFYETAIEVSEELPDIKLGIFDAVKYSKDAKKFKIKGYPTFWYFKDSEFKFKYFGSRSKRDFAAFLNDPAEQEEPPELEELEWKAEDNSQVVELQTEMFDQYLEKNKHVLVFFYIKHCQICLSTIKPEYEKAARIAHEENYKTKLVVIRADTNKKLSDKYEVNSFPTFIYFKKGKKKFNYKGSWISKKLLKFLKKPSEKLAQKIKPTSWQDEDASLSGNVVHLSNVTFDDFLQNHEHSLVMFHSLYSKESKEAQVGFRTASIQLAELDPSVKLGAVDCFRKPEQGVLCYKFSIRNHPTYKYYFKGKFLLELPVTKAEDVVTFLQWRHQNPTEPASAEKTKDEL